ncbi:BatD family protein [Aliivibrio sp. S4MY1]|uniref:BatD family protein n=2 Tax=Aliivibrio TaxID=511678 RepID=UPI002377F4F0|nr:BatD family protein [Aliivibrio sp. S4MY1]MDD9204353.1 BatD family protein [Aliivibrio sp. S4MY1]
MSIRQISPYSTVKSSTMKASMKKTTLIKKVILFTTLCVSGISASYAQAIATVSKNQITENEVIQLMVSIDKSVDQSTFDPSQLAPDFRSGQIGFKESYLNNNGNTSKYSQWTVSIIPTKMGSLTIPSMNVAGEQTNPITIRVTKDATAPKSSDVIKVSGELTKDELYEGETAQFDAKIAIFADIRRLKDPNIITPQGNGIEFSPIGESKQYQTVIDGLQATVVEQAFSVSANQAGQLSFDGLAFTGGLVQTERYGRSTKLIPLNITPKQYQLTVLAKPADFTGTWLPTTDLKLGQQWLVDGKPLSNTTIEAGTAITRQITLMMEDVPPEKLPKLDIDYPKSVRMYDEKPLIGKDSQGNSVMTIKQVIIPHTGGTVKLPAVSIQWWNSTTRKSETATLDSLTLTVTPSTQVNEQKIESQTNAQPETTIKREVDHGFWPYTTLAFALLWILTAIGWAISRTKVKAINTSTNQKSIVIGNGSKALISALKQNNTILAHQILADHNDQWAKQGIDVAVIKELITQLSQQQYARNTSNSSTKQIISDIEKKLSSTSQSSNPISELERL